MSEIAISKTPYRVSFAGGGTDLPAFYQAEPGAVLSCAIERFCYCFQIEDFDNPLNVPCIHTIPRGSGLGSSGSEHVGKKRLELPHDDAGSIACSAWHHEAYTCEAVGKQDHYAAAIGGLNYIVFKPDGSVTATPVECSPETIAELEARCMLVYTGQSREAKPILEAQAAITDEKRETLQVMAAIASLMCSYLERGDLESFEDNLRYYWTHKASLGCGITTDRIDAMLGAAFDAGAQGAKLCGAGGGGFMLLMADPDRHGAIKAALGSPKTIPFKICWEGSHVLSTNSQTARTIVRLEEEIGRLKSHLMTAHQHS